MFKNDGKFCKIFTNVNEKTTNIKNIIEYLDWLGRKNYNPNKLVEEVQGKETALEKKIQSPPPAEIIDENLPALPKISTPNSTKNATNKPTVLEPVKTKPYTGGNIKVKSGTSFYVTNNNSISDWQRKGTKVRFTTNGNTYGKYFTIPSGTIFQGEIIDSHQPQITCNGGLIVIRVDSMIYKGVKVPVTAYVTRANDKKIFFNDILKYQFKLFYNLKDAPFFGASFLI